MREWVTTVLDVLGLLLVAAGLAAGAWGLVGPAALLVAGAVVLAGSWLAVRQVPAPGAPADALGVERPVQMHVEGRPADFDRMADVVRRVMPRRQA